MRVVKYTQNNNEEIQRIIERSELNLDDVIETVRSIIMDVRENGDSALIKYTSKFDGQELRPEDFRVSEDEIKRAYSRVDKDLIEAIRHVYTNIEKFHTEQFNQIKKVWEIETEEGVSITERVLPVQSSGSYVPGGRANYPSTVLMSCIPAKIAGVKRIVVVSPPPISDEILIACDICGVTEIYCVGGAQAIAALAHGTESIQSVDKIVGPGNKYVMAAKLVVFGRVAIDNPAGPSEILIIADENTNPKFIAADLLAQAEHDPDAQCILVTDSDKIIEETEKEIIRQVGGLKRKEIIEKSIENLSVILTENMSDAIDFTNKYAPEHLEILMANSEKTAKKIKNAGTIFLGEYSTVSTGDYASGSNHILPTGGAARFLSQLGVTDFLKTTTIQKITKEGLFGLKKTIETLAESEGLDAHSNAVKIRFD